MTCPNCRTDNDPNNRFCIECGKPLTVAAEPSPPVPAGITCPNCGTYNDATARFCMKCGTALTAAAPPPPTTPVHTPAPPAGALAGWALPGQPAYPPQHLPPQAHQPSGYAVEPYGASGTAGLNIWGPFAGYGARRRHVGWLMDGQGHRAQELLDKVRSKFNEREIPGAKLTEQTLVAKGVLVEVRPYFILKRGLASLALYIAQFGRDLFISQASYLKPPISAFRVIVAGMMITVAGFMTFAYPVAWGASGQAIADSISLFGGGPSGGAVASFIFLTCVVGPLGALNNLLLFVLFCYSAYKWLTAKDVLAALRVPPNEFNEDDLMAMEKAVEETVRQSLTDLKLNPDDLKMATAGRGGGQLF